jgi:CheY-like chemotaxis protein
MTLTILLVEDSDEDFLAFQRAFQHANMSYPIQRCTKGDEALDYLYRRGRYAAARDQPLPALILLDLNLPGADGRSVLSTIKGDPQLACIPVIIVTSSANPKDIDTCYQNGANSYLVKSVNFLKFRQQIGVLTDYWLNVAQLPGNQDVLGYCFVK